jgi:hypothetical protein
MERESESGYYELNELTDPYPSYQMIMENPVLSKVFRPSFSLLLTFARSCLLCRILVN